MKRALISVWDKSGIDSFAEELHGLGFELVSTGGTARHLRDLGLPVTDVAEITKFPEILDGRVKTLHPYIHAGLLADQSNPDHGRALAEHGIGSIQVLAVNLYPFIRTVSGEHTLEEAIEMIDIGGPAMLRAAAKNYRSVTAICDPLDYPKVIEELRSQGQVSLETRRRLMAKVFGTVAVYDAQISAYFHREEEMPDPLTIAMPRWATLRYGENPWQLAAAYIDPSYLGPCALHAAPLGGKELSYNNILDADAAIAACWDFDGPAAVVVKHLTPCGAAIAEDASAAIRTAIDADSVSAFGGIVAVNRPIGDAEAKELIAPNQFLEVICAPAFSETATELIQARSGWGQNVRLLAIGEGRRQPGHDIRSVAGGLLVQTVGAPPFQPRTVSSREPMEQERTDLAFAWQIAAFVKSNGIVVAKNGRTLGIGSGQTNRVGSVRIALEQAAEQAKGAVLASDGFFPFADSIEGAAKAGISAILQPGGSKRDPEVIEAVNKYEMAMLFTDVRCFRH